MVEQQPGQVISPNDQPSDQTPSVQNPPQSNSEAAIPAQPSPAQQPASPPLSPVVSSSATTQIPISPTEAQQQPQNVASTSQSQSTQAQAAPVMAPQQPDATAPTNEPTSQFSTSGFDRSDMMPATDDPSMSAREPSEVTAVSWTASEYIGHNKSPGWFLALAILVITVSIGVYFLTKDILSAVVIIVVGIIFGMYAGRKPHEQTYAVDDMGVAIGDKLYTYDRLRSFTVHQEDAFPSITFMPFGRFMPPISIYYEPKDEEQIIESLSAYLPYETYKRDPVDALMRKIRF